MTYSGNILHGMTELAHLDLDKTFDLIVLPMRHKMNTKLKNGIIFILIHLTLLLENVTIFFVKVRIVFPISASNL